MCSDLIRVMQTDSVFSMEAVLLLIVILFSGLQANSQHILIRTASSLPMNLDRSARAQSASGIGATQHSAWLG